MLQPSEQSCSSIGDGDFETGSVRGSSAGTGTVASRTDVSSSSFYECGERTPRACVDIIVTSALVPFIRIGT
jgi:hypothetical protein